MKIKKWFNITGIAVFVLIVGWCIYYMKHKDAYRYCISDGVSFGMLADCFGKCVILIILSYLYITKNDFSYMRILQMKSRYQIWLSQSRDIVIYAFVWTVLYISLLLMLGKTEFGSNGLFDAKWYGSVFWQVMLKAFLLCFLQLLCSLFFTLLIRWLLDTGYFALAVLAFIGISDGNHFFIPIFYRRFNYSLEMWSVNNAAAVKPLLCLALIATALFAAGLYQAGRKEFMNESYSAQ
ncbi:MAG: hypothetical protein PUE71_10615 [Clostridia bacterium]|nr:hypothetical protein [Clostridia bacterium]